MSVLKTDDGATRRRFESCPFLYMVSVVQSVERSAVNRVVMGSIPIAHPYMTPNPIGKGSVCKTLAGEFNSRRGLQIGAVAQWLEQAPVEGEVAGSSPVGAAKSSDLVRIQAPRPGVSVKAARTAQGPVF